MLPSIIYSHIPHPADMSDPRVTIYWLSKSVPIFIFKHVPISGRVISNLKELSIDIIARAKTHSPRVYYATDLCARSIIKYIRYFIIHDNFSIKELLPYKGILKI